MTGLIKALDIIKGLGLVDATGTVIIAALFLWFAWRLVNKLDSRSVEFFEKWTEAQKRQAKAMSRQAEAIDRQAGAMESQADAMSNIKDTVKAFVEKDSSEHREILLSVQVVGKELKRVTDGLHDLRRDDDGKLRRSETQPDQAVDIRDFSAGAS